MCEEGRFCHVFIPVRAFFLLLPILLLFVHTCSGLYSINVPVRSRFSFSFWFRLRCHTIVFCCCCCCCFVLNSISSRKYINNTKSYTEIHQAELIMIFLGRGHNTRTLYNYVHKHKWKDESNIDADKTHTQNYKNLLKKKMFCFDVCVVLFCFSASSSVEDDWSTCI